MNLLIYFLVFSAGSLFGFMVAAIMAAGGRADDRMEAATADTAVDEASIRAGLSR